MAYSAALKPINLNLLENTEMKCFECFVNCLHVGWKKDRAIPVYDGNLRFPSGVLNMNLKAWLLSQKSVCV